MVGVWKPEKKEEKLLNGINRKYMQLEDGYRRNGVDGEEARENGNEKKYTNNNNNLN